MLIGILRNEDERSAIKWKKACENLNLAFDIIDLVSHDWFKKVTEKRYDFFLLKPGGEFERYKQLYDERIYIINKIMKFNIFPSFEEAYIYENKKLLSYYLDAKKIPHPKTFVFYNSKEACNFIGDKQFPLVGKTSIGASGTGVEILKSKADALSYIKKAFSKKGIKRRFGPNRVVGSPKKWIDKAIKSPEYFIKRLKEYIEINNEGQKGYVIFQEYIKHDYEWRAVKIGDSYFAHKKIKSGEKASGSKGIDYVNPPHGLLDFLKTICDKNNFNSVAIDIFEDAEKGFLVNEVQTIFGHVQSHILEVDGKPGRYINDSGNWLFEAGDFNTNESYDLRLQTALMMYGKK